MEIRPSSFVSCFFGWFAAF